MPHKKIVKIAKRVGRTARKAVSTRFKKLSKTGLSKFFGRRIKSRKSRRKVKRSTSLRIPRKIGKRTVTGQVRPAVENPRFLKKRASRGPRGKKSRVRRTARR